MFCVNVFGVYLILMGVINMELNDSEKETIKRALDLYEDMIKFSLRNRKAKRGNLKVVKYIDLYNQDLLNIDDINEYLK